MKFGVPGVFNIDTELLLELSNTTFLGEAIKSGSSACPCHSSKCSLSCRITLFSPFLLCFASLRVSWPWVEFNFLSLTHGFGSKVLALEISNSSSCRNAAHSGLSSPFPLDARAAVTQLRKVASPRESYLELNPPLAVLIHTSQC